MGDPVAGRRRGVDLHVHSNASDGTDPPERVVERALESGLAAIALTDHDTTEGIAEARSKGRELGVEVVPGIEISAEHEGAEVHLLAYFIRPDDPALTARLSAFRAQRARRVETIVERLHALGLAVPLDTVRRFASGGSIGRPHVADALVQGGYVPTYEVAWKQYLGRGGKAFVDRARMDVDEAVALVRGAGGVVSIAHPSLNLDLAAVERLAGRGIAAIETAHPKVGETDSRALSELCRRRGLVETGGSDCHGGRRGEPTMGRVSVPVETLEALRRLAS